MAAGDTTTRERRDNRPEPRSVRPLSGFEHLARSWDVQEQVHLVRILPGELCVSNDDEVITTVLGSCISACIYDETLGVGGMNHFMLPDSGAAAGGGGTQAARYGLNAMEQLVNGIMKNGGRRDRLQVKIFGGGKMIPAMSDVGARNIEFVRNYLREEGFVLIAEDVGDVYPRKVHFYPTSGRVRVKRLRPLHRQALADRERALMRDIVAGPGSGEVELF